MLGRGNAAPLRCHLASLRAVPVAHAANPYQIMPNFSLASGTQSHIRTANPASFLRHGSAETDPPALDYTFLATASACFTAHPRLNVCISLLSGGSHFDVNVPGAVVDSGAKCSSSQSAQISGSRPQRRVATRRRPQFTWQTQQLSASPL